MKTLVVRLDHLGDLLLTTPLIRALSLGGHTVDVLVQDSLKPIFLGSPYVERCIGIAEVAPTFPTRWLPLGIWMRRSRYDNLVLAYARESRLCLASTFSGAEKRIAMWAGVWGRLTGHRCLASHMVDRPRPVSEILLACSRALGAADQGLKPDLFLTTEEQELARNLIPEKMRARRLLGIHPGSAGNACNLPTETYADLAALLLSNTDSGLIITGTENEIKLLQKWPSEILSSDRVWVTMGKLSLRELGSVIAEMSVYVCSSTGPLHVASAVGTPTVSPFCPAPSLNATLWGNLGAASRIVEPKNCPRMNGKNETCNFFGQITAAQLETQVLGLLAR
ncbi:MAG: glycosyltransferase family 9 protein [Chthoniobacterales bacterium]|nr:glycosyltransferase family 9 protein [Chthoniobacterales bacterium]